MFNSDFSLIPADQPFAVIAALFAIGLFGFWAERKNWGKMATGTVWTLLAAIIASNIGLIPKSSQAHDFVFTYLVPAIIPLFLMNANVKRIIAESGRVGVCFILACLGTAAGAIVGVSLLDLGAHEADLAGIFTATYTGGSVNYAALIQATGFDDASMISAATAVDNLMSAIFLAVIAIMPASKWLMGLYAKRNHHAVADYEASTSETDVTGFSMAIAITYTLAVVALSDITVNVLNQFSQSFDFGTLRYVFITLFSVLPATFAPNTMSKMKGGQSIGLVLAFVFFGAIASGADVSKLVNLAPILLAFVVILLMVHFVVVFGAGWLLTKVVTKVTKNKNNANLALSLPELIVASNAAILGATTAPALAMARGWGGLATPGVLVGVAGYIVGTPLGLAVVNVLN